MGIIDIDANVRRDEEYQKRLAQAQTEASIDALTGVKNKYAYLKAEERLDNQIELREQPNFAITLLDVNDLKIINDTEGHKAGDRYLQDACRIICRTFKHSPVYRVGGDEFAVISQGEDFERVDELTRALREYSEKAVLDGGIVIACGMSKYHDDSCVAAVFERADQYMYENKSWLKKRKEVCR